jgi:hypothetical protein
MIPTNDQLKEKEGLMMGRPQYISNFAFLLIIHLPDTVR